jgi:hypothetical protein
MFQTDYTNNLDANGIQQEKWNTDHDTATLTIISFSLFWNKHEEGGEESLVKRKNMQYQFSISSAILTT